MKYQVTIAIPVYNVGKDVERALYSALEQTFSSIEYLIIDDKGTDDSIDLIKNIIAHHPRGNNVRIIDHVVNRGTGATKNSAIKEATGNYLYFMDSDDTITPNCIERLYNEITSRPVDFVAASFQKVSPDGKDVLQVVQFSNTTRREAYALAEYRQGEVEKFYIMTWNKLYNLSFLREKDIRCIPHHLNEDVWFSFQLNYTVSSFTLLSDITYNWFVRENSTTNTMLKQGISRKKVDSFLEVIGYKKKAIRENKVAQRCPFIVDDVVEFTIRLSEFLLRSMLNKSEQQELILKLTDVSDIRFFKPHRLMNKFIYKLYGLPQKRYLFAYLNAVRYGRGLLYALKHPVESIKKRI